MTGAGVSEVRSASNALIFIEGCGAPASESLATKGAVAGSGVGGLDVAARPLAMFHGGALQQAPAAGGRALALT